MKSKKIHLSILKDNLWVKCCDTRKSTFYEFSKDISKVTCESCKKTKYYKEQEQKMESERVASSEELGYEVIKFEKDTWSNYLTDCKYHHNKVADYDCVTRCKYFISETRTEVKCSYKAKNKPKEIEKEPSIIELLHAKLVSFIYEKYGDMLYIDMNEDGYLKISRIGYIKTDLVDYGYYVKMYDIKHKNVATKIEKKIIQLVSELDNKPKTQLEKDTEKYNLNDEQVEYLKGFDYQVRDNYDYCDGCLFNENDFNCDNVWCKDEKIFVFKQVHKTQKSLNESIEKESIEDYIDVPFDNQKWRTLDNGNIEIVNVSIDDILKINEYLRKNNNVVEIVSHSKNIVVCFEKKSDENKFKKFMLTLEEKEDLEEGIEEPFSEVVKLEEFKLTGDTLRVDTSQVSRIFDENDNMIWVKPPKYKPEDVAFKSEETKQESKHYQNGLETIQKIKSTLDNLDGEITLFQAYCLGNVIKYEDRAGLKDDKDKDLYKASDYTAMMVNNNWIGKEKK